MDGGDRRQSHYGTPYQPSRPGRPAPGQSMGPPPPEQYSHSATTPSPSPSRTDMAAASTARSYMPSYQYGYQDTQFPPQLQYQTPYVQDTRSQSLQSPSGQQQYATYGHGSMLPPVGQQSLYETLPQYQQQQRQLAAIEVMAGQFGAPQLYPQSHESGSVGVGQQTPQYYSSQAEQQSYGSSMARPPQLQPPFGGSSAEYSMIEHTPVSQVHDEASTRHVTEDGRRQYEQQLKATFEAIQAGRVTEASDKLSSVTEWLVASIRALGR